MSVRPDGSRTGKGDHPTLKPVCSVRQDIVTGDLYVGYSFGKGVTLVKDSDDWLDMMDILRDLSPSGRVQPNLNDGKRSVS